MRTAIIGMLFLTACEPLPTELPNGCPIMLTELGRAAMRSCTAAYEAQRLRALARQNGGTVTECVDTLNGTTCTTY